MIRVIGTAEGVCGHTRRRDRGEAGGSWQRSSVDAVARVALAADDGGTCQEGLDVNGEGALQHELLVRVPCNALGAGKHVFGPADESRADGIICRWEWEWDGAGDAERVGVGAILDVVGEVMTCFSHSRTR